MFPRTMCAELRTHTTTDWGDAAADECDDCVPDDEGELAGDIARGLSLHKRSRLHFVRGSRVEAARVAEEAKNHFETGRCSL